MPIDRALSEGRRFDRGSAEWDDDNAVAEVVGPHRTMGCVIEISSSADVGSFRIYEEKGLRLVAYSSGAGLPWSPKTIAERNGYLDRLIADWTEVRHLMLLPMRPQVFDGIEFGCIGRQKLQLDIAAFGVDVIADQAAAMGLQAIPNDEKFAAAEMAAEILRKATSSGARTAPLTSLK